MGDAERQLLTTLIDGLVNAKKLDCGYWLRGLEILACCEKRRFDVFGDTYDVLENLTGQSSSPYLQTEANNVVDRLISFVRYEYINSGKHIKFARPGDDLNLKKQWHLELLKPKEDRLRKVVIPALYKRGSCMPCIIAFMILGTMHLLLLQEMAILEKYNSGTSIKYHIDVRMMARRYGGVLVDTMELLQTIRKLHISSVYLQKKEPKKMELQKNELMKDETQEKEAPKETAERGLLCSARWKDNLTKKVHVVEKVVTRFSTPNHASLRDMFGNLKYQALLGRHKHVASVMRELEHSLFNPHDVMKAWGAVVHNPLPPYHTDLHQPPHIPPSNEFKPRIKL